MNDQPQNPPLAPGDIGDASAPATACAVSVFRTPKSQRIFAVAGDPEYLSEYAEPASGLFVWSYVVCFANLSDRPVQLVGRKWMIHESTGKSQLVLAASVGGERPWLQPGATHIYSSGVPLPTHLGSMTGAFGFRTEEGAPIVVETARFELKGPRPRRHRPAMRELNDRDATGFRAALEHYANAVDDNQDAELRIMRLRGVSDEGRRVIIRYLLFVFPFNETKATRVSFQELNIRLIEVNVFDIFILYDADIGEIDIVMKYWRNPPNIDFLEAHIILGSMTKPLSGPDLTPVRLLAAFNELKKINLDDSSIDPIDRVRIAKRVLHTYYKLKQSPPEGIQIERDDQVRMADRIVQAKNRARRREKLAVPSPL